MLASNAVDILRYNLEEVDRLKSHAEALAKQARAEMEQQQSSVDRYAELKINILAALEKLGDAKDSAVIQHLRGSK